MIKVRALKDGKTRMVGHIKTQSGELLDFTEVIDSDACRIAFNACRDDADIIIPSYDDIFGLIGYSGPCQWRVYRHFAHHAARM